MSTNAGFTLDRSACTSISTCRLAVTCGVTFRLMPVCSKRTVARGGWPPPVPALTSITRIGTRSPTRISAARLSSRSEEHTSELQSRGHLVCRLLLEKTKKHNINHTETTSEHVYMSDSA